MSFIYGYLVVLSTALWAAFTYFVKLPVRYMSLMCLVGYSVALYIPCTILGPRSPPPSPCRHRRRHRRRLLPPTDAAGLLAHCCADCCCCMPACALLHPLSTLPPHKCPFIYPSPATTMLATSTMTPCTATFSILAWPSIVLAGVGSTLFVLKSIVPVGSGARSSVVR